MITQRRLRELCTTVGVLGAVLLGCFAYEGMMRWAGALPGIVIFAALIAVGTQRFPA